MSHHKTPRELHAEHTDSRDEAALRLRTIRGLEDHARDALKFRLFGALVQGPERHFFHECPVTPVSPRRGFGWPDAPGHEDSTGFSDGVV